MCYPKAEAGPFLTLGSEKWLEDPPHMVGRNSATVVDEGNANAMACRLLAPVPGFTDSQCKTPVFMGGVHSIYEQR